MEVISCSWGSNKQLGKLLLTLLKQTSRTKRRGAEWDSESVWKTTCILPCMACLRFWTLVTCGGQCGIFCCSMACSLRYKLHRYRSSLSKELCTSLCNREKKVLWGQYSGCCSGNCLFYIQVFRTIVHKEPGLGNTVNKWRWLRKTTPNCGLSLSPGTWRIKIPRSIVSRKVIRLPLPPRTCSRKWPPTCCVISLSGPKASQL